ncbi:unnamed protein product [Darwinula stevensoni]|uniref:non-specific serine/threonine protein kinase n=1 Tax=Darwinula stevensoni TaxID=69355 RepID=A0A7R9FRV5_9CRUS|nr:unnamed protein product [Darwinula stevensoni]CAG0902173.1 unnamed protein product [Darwinula stevensoni]
MEITRPAPDRGSHLVGSSKVNNAITLKSALKKNLRITPTKEKKKPKGKSFQEEVNFLHLQFPSLLATFSISRRIGEGGFSNVYLAELRSNTKVQFAVKHIIPTSLPVRIEKEIICLNLLKGKQNVIELKHIIRSGPHILLVMPFIAHEKFTHYFMKMSVCEIQDYVKNLLMALKSVHELDIIHRDVKPANFLVDRWNRTYSLVDFGLAQLPPSLLKSKEENATSEKEQLKDACTADELKEDLESPSKQSSASLKQKANSRAALKSCTNVLEVSRAGEPDDRKGSPNQQLLPIVRTQRNLSGRPSGTKPSVNVKNSPCKCFFGPYVCDECTKKPVQYAYRAGTPGFRAPEVLMKCPFQTTAVDIWSVGVIFLSMLSRRYPFFKAPDDCTALAEIITLLGSQPVCDMADHCGKHLLLSEPVCPSDLKDVCLSLRHSVVEQLNDDSEVKEQRKPENRPNDIPDMAFDLLKKLLDPNPYTRITAAEALQHPFICDA